MFPQIDEVCEHDFMNEFCCLVKATKYSEHSIASGSAFGFRAASELSTVASSRIDRGIMGYVVQAMPSLASLAMRNSAEAQQLFGTAWGVPRCAKIIIHTYTPSQKLTIAAASALALFSPSYLTYTRRRITHVIAPLVPPS
jgi:hypothetical protein